MYIHENILLRYFYNKKYFRRNVQKKSKHAFCIQCSISENRAPFWDNVENYGRERQAKEGNIIGRMRIAFSINNATHTHTHTHIHTKCDTYCFTTAKVITRTRLDALLIRTIRILVYCLSCLKSEL